MFGTDMIGFIQPIVGIELSYAAVILFSRVAGLRSFIKLSGYDFAATIAMDSLLASAAIGKLPLWSGRPEKIDVCRTRNVENEQGVKENIRAVLIFR